MNFLNVQTALIAAAVSVSLLVLFYFLKLRRRQRVISSTLLWLRSVQDLHVNTFFQWLKHNWLLWLQLLVLAVLLVALADPVINRRQSRDRKYVLMIDASASMSATDGGNRTRLDRAIEDAGRLVDNLKDADEVMVVSFSDRPRVLSTFTTLKAETRDALQRITPRHSSTRLAAAMQIVDSVTRNAAVEPVVYLYTDGRIPDAGEAILSRGRINIVNVARGSDNVAVMTLAARRNYQDPDKVAVQAEVRNFGPRPVELDVQLVIQQRIADAGHLELGAYEPPEMREGSGADRRVLRFAVDGAESGVYRVRITRPDHLAADNVAAVILPPAKRARGLLVTTGNYFLEPIMKVLAKGAFSPLAEVKTVTPTEFEAADVQKAVLRGDFDLIVLDNYHPRTLSDGNYLMFHVAPNVEGVTTSGKDVSGTILTWKRGHPALRYLSVELLYAARWLEMKLPKKATALIEADTGPIVAHLRAGGSEYLIVGFDLLQSNWPLGRQFAIFMANAVQFLSGPGAAASGGSVPAGTGLTLPGAQGGGVITVTDPRNEQIRLTVDRRGEAFFDRTDLVGVYAAEGARPGHELFAVNLFNPIESRISPPPDEQFVIGADRLDPGTQIHQSAVLENVSIWPILAWAVLGLLLLEWAVYQRKVRI